MKLIIKGLKEFLFDVREDFNCALRAVCGRPSPIKRLVIVVIICGVLSGVSVSTLVRSVYNTGKRDAKAEMIHIEHIKQLELKHSSDSINSIKNYGHEYE
ncbi:MAG: TraL conjugative transposon family protein [Prevotellaceae bacterium]|jgi:hypothetical protein|nr:TraL conjugative transposon family protein [Prevotellaceae bacterium]